MEKRAAGGIRAQARREVTAKIVSIAEGQLAEYGGAGLSLRAIAREMGMASSAMYRYFPSIEALLTELIVRAYTELADAAEAALTVEELPSESEGSEADPGRAMDAFLAVCHACRDWALTNPHRYVLIYGSPIPGYQAPAATVEQVARTAAALVRPWAPGSAVAASDRMAPEFFEVENLAAQIPFEVEPDAWGAGIAAWSHMFGLISFEIFGQFNHLVSDRRGYFDAVMRAWARRLV